MQPIDITTQDGRVAWSNALVALRVAIAEQEAKVASIHAGVAAQTNAAEIAPYLAKQEKALAALRKRLKEELSRETSVNEDDTLRGECPRSR